MRGTTLWPITDEVTFLSSSSSSCASSEDATVKGWSSYSCCIDQYHLMFTQFKFPNKIFSFLEIEWMERPSKVGLGLFIETNQHFLIQETFSFLYPDG